MHSAILEKVKKIGIVPVVVLEDAKDAAPLAKALIEGGLPCAEVTFRTEAGEIVENSWRMPMDLSEVPFVYHDMKDFEPSLQELIFKNFTVVRNNIVIIILN